MDGRGRFLGIARSQLKDQLFLPFNLNYDWFMKETVDRWRREGLPADVDLLTFFGFDQVRFVTGKTYTLVPSFEEQVLSEDDVTAVVRDGDGVTKRVFKRYAQSKMPQWLDFPVKRREDFGEIRRRLDPSSPSRYPRNLDGLKARWKDRDYPLGVGCGSFYGHTLQKWVGTQRLCMLFYDDPTFVHEMLEHLEFFFLGLLERLVPDVEFDFASFGEDIAYKGRSFISPRIFRDFLQPRYVRICEFLRSHGVDILFVDSDGYVDELIPLWLEVGINGFSPLEVAAGEDARVLKKRYGKDVVLAGNIDKRALIRGKGEIDKEIEKVKELLELGGYFPAVDHSVPPDVPYENFAYLLERLRDA